MGGGESRFITGIGTHLTQPTTEVTPPSSVAERVHGLVYNRDGNFMWCKICTKAKASYGMSKESKGKIFILTLRSFDMLVFKNTK